MHSGILKINIRTATTSSVSQGDAEGLGPVAALTCLGDGHDSSICVMGLGRTEDNRRMHGLRRRNLKHFT